MMSSYFGSDSKIIKNFILCNRECIPPVPIPTKKKKIACYSFYFLHFIPLVPDPDPYSDYQMSIIEICEDCVIQSHGYFIQTQDQYFLK